MQSNKTDIKQKAQLQDVFTIRQNRECIYRRPYTFYENAIIIKNN